MRRPGSGRRRVRFVLYVALGALLLSNANSGERAADRFLDFDRRVAAQAAIERVYQRHRTNGSGDFDAVVLRPILQAKVRRYLQMSVLLESEWGLKVTATMLEREMQRMARDTRDPVRLRELFEALGNDSLLLQECLARPLVVERFVSNLYSYDSRLHRQVRREADALRAALDEGRSSPHATDPRRHEVTYIEDQGQPIEAERSDLIAMDAESFEQKRSRLPPSIGAITAVTESADAFSFEVLLDASADRLVVAEYRIEKIPWEWFWAERVDGLGPVDVVEVADPAVDVPAIGAGVQCIGNEVWSPLGPTELAFFARRGHTAIWTGSEMIVWGGLISSSFASSDGRRYDPATDSWRLMASAPGGGRHRHTAVWTGSQMIVFGGATGSGVLVTGGQRYDPVADSWSAVSNVLAPPSRQFHTAVWTGTEMIVWGGDPLMGAEGGGRYDPVLDSWRPTIGADGLNRRMKHVAVWDGSRMLIWGGESESGALPAHGLRYDPANDSLTVMSEIGAPTGRIPALGVWTGSEMIVWGGFATPTGARYNPVTDTWAPISSINEPVTRSESAGVWTGTRMLVWGGVSSSGANLLDGAQYDPTTDSWSAMTVDNVPSSRRGHSAVWTGNEMLVWGGYNATVTPLGTGGRYDPAMDRWITMTPTSNTPWTEGSAAVWTGAEMIVWSGRTHGVGQRGGWSYDPAIDDWRAISTIDAPSPRRNAKAVWTGNEMVVWGGVAAPDPEVGTLPTLATGGRYSPLTDSWTATSTTSAPSPRQRHTVVWTGTEVIVWGGFANAAATITLGSGGAYDPLADTWRAVSSVGAPSSRSLHTAVWTGSMMIVWGGIQSLPTTYLFTGGRYDPIADSWAQVSEANLWWARADHAATWSGDRMILTGGRDSGQVFADAREYDPIANVWTTLAAAPFPRYRHGAVWTGTELLTWGGSTVPQSAPWGARYVRALDSWLPIALQGAPGSLVEPHIFWTGAGMLVWGTGSTSDSGRGGFFVSGVPIDGDGDGICDAVDCDPDNPNCSVNCTDADGDGWCVPHDCDDLGSLCQEQCMDADDDGIPSCFPDCDDLNPNCGVDCTDADADGYCVPADCDDSVASCNSSCANPDQDGLRTCDGDCAPTNPNCTSDCTDTDADGYCVTHDCDDSQENCRANCLDADGDDWCSDVDCNDSLPFCTEDCADADNDGYCASTDCQPLNARCNSDCTDADGDGWCVTHDCDDTQADCTFDCDVGDSDGDGLAACAGDCAEGNPHCRDDCTDADGDGFCVTSDCIDANPLCTTDCTDTDGDGFCVTTDCDDASPSCSTSCEDADADGARVCEGDCDDTSSAARPGLDETCNDGLDNDCNGFADGADVACSGLECERLWFENREEVRWDPAGGADAYALYRGWIPTTGWAGYNHACEATELPAPEAHEPDAPPPGVVYYYLSNGLAIDPAPGRTIVAGSLGTASDGSARLEPSGLTCGPRIHVDPDVVAGSRNGLSWADAYTSLQAAFQHSGSTGRGLEIWIRGTSPTGGGLLGDLRPGARILGGFAGTETLPWERSPVAHPTVIQGNGGGFLISALRAAIAVDGLTLRGTGSGIIVAEATDFIDVSAVEFEDISAWAIDVSSGDEATLLTIADVLVTEPGAGSVRAVARGSRLTGLISGNRLDGGSDAAMRIEARATIADAETALDLIRNEFVGGARGLVLGAHVMGQAIEGRERSFVASNVFHDASQASIAVEASGSFSGGLGPASASARPWIVGNTLSDGGGAGVRTTAVRTDSSTHPASHAVRAEPELWDNLITFHGGPAIAESTDDEAANWVADPLVVGNDLHGNGSFYVDEDGTPIIDLSQVNALAGARDNLDSDPRYVDRAARDYHLRSGTVVGLGSIIRYLANGSDPGIGMGWTLPAFDDDAWETGLYGIGYDDAPDSPPPDSAEDLLTTVIDSGTSSLYTRVAFDVPNTSKVVGLVLGVDYDDGFVAWINGVEVARSTSMPPGAPAWNSSPISHESSNGAVPAFEDIDVTATALPVLQNGSNLLSIAVWNTGAASTDLVLVPRLVINDDQTVIDAGHADAPRIAVEDQDGHVRTRDGDSNGVAATDLGADER